MMRYVCAVLLMLQSASFAFAVRHIEVGKPIQLRLEVQQLTVLVLPEPLSSATSVLPPERLALGEDGQYVTFMLHDPTVPPGRIAIVGVSGALYLVQYIVAPKGDEVVHLIHKTPAPVPQVGIASLVRSIRHGSPVPGAVPAEVALPTIADPRVSLSQPRGQRVGPYLVLSVLVQNQSEAPVTLDERIGELEPPETQTVPLALWVWPPQLTVKGVWLADTVLPAQGQTLLAVIFEEVRP